MIKNAEKKLFPNIFFISLLVFGTFILYSNTLHYKFLNWDDDKHITENPYIKTLDKSTFFNLYVFEKHTSLTLLTYALNYKFNKLEPFTYRFVNILFHILNILLVFILVLRINGNKIIAFITAILFACHPMRVESVVWISERKDLLFVFFSLLAILIYIKYIKSNFSFYWFLIVVIITWFASISKIQAAVLPILLIVCDIFHKRKFDLLSILEKLVLLYIIFIFTLTPFNKCFNQLLQLILLVSVYYIINKVKLYQLKLKHIIFLSILFITIGFISKMKFFYIPLTVFFIYERYIQGILSYTKVFVKLKKPILIIIIIFSSLLLFIYFLVKHPPEFWSNTGLNELSISIGNRFILAGYSLFNYLFKFFLPINLTAINPYPVIDNGWFPLKYYFYSVCSILIISFTIYKIIKSKMVKSEFTFWILFFLINIGLVIHIIPIEGRLVAADRYSYFAYIGLFALVGHSFVFLKNNKKLKNYINYIFITICLVLFTLAFNRNKVWKDNFSLLNDVLKKNPDVSFAHWNLGNAFLEINNYHKSIFHYKKALELNPKPPDKSIILCNLGWAKFNLSDTIGAIKEIQNAIALNNNNQIALNNLGWIYYSMKKFNNAYIEFSKSITADSTNFSVWINRGILHNEIGKYQNAIYDFKKAILLNPDYYFAYNNAGWAEFNLLQYNKAVNYYNKAISINKKFELSYYNRALAKYNLKDFYGAIADFETSIKLNPNRIYNYYYCGNAFYNLNQVQTACNYWLTSSKMGCKEAQVAIQKVCKQ